MREQWETKIDSALTLNEDLARTLLVDFIRTEIHRTGMRKAVIGVSGGIDSALSAYLTVEALGADSLLAVILPHRTSNPDSEKDAHRVVEALGCRHKVIDITQMTDPYIEAEQIESPLRKGNIYARARMSVLYDQSSAEGALVVGTSNKTESLLGYSTLFGDSAWAINPLGDLYKRQVRQLSRALGVPDSILTKAPSADLWLGQTDEDELGMSYDEADRLLYLMVDRRERPDQVVAKGFERARVDAVAERIVRYQFKRVPGPIPKLSTRTLGVDWLYARDWQS